MKRRISAAVIVVSLFASAALAAGCGNLGAGKRDVYPLDAFAEKLDRHLAKYRDRVVGNRLVTYCPGDLRGKLPAAAPAAVVTRGNPEHKRIALTIDDGWNADLRILDLLKKWKVKFTAFLIGGRGVAESNPDFVQAIKDAGGEVCNHTYTHYVMKGKDEATVVDNIWRAQDVITRVTHEIYPYVRFSGGLYDDAAVNWAAREGFWVVNWTFSAGDTAPGIAVDTEVNNILSNLKPGGILLCHWGGHNTYEVLARAIPEMQKRGYEVTSLSKVLEGTPYLLKAGRKDGG